MIYKAVVLDNSMFYQRGTIRVRIAGFFERKFDWDLSENFPNFIEEGENEEGFSNDFEAYITSPLGGGRNYGMFFLPQINEKGLVAFLGENRRTPIWLGSFFEPERDDNFDVSHVNIPSDDPEQEGENTDGVIEGSQNMKTEEEGDALNKNIVIRTKNTSRESAEKVNWQEQRTTNIAVLSDKEVRIKHFPKEDGWDDTTPQKWQEILLSKNDEDENAITASVENTKDKKTGTISITDSKIVVKIESEDVTQTITGDLENGMEAKLEGQNSHSFKITDDSGFEFSTDKDTIIKATNAHLDVDNFKVSGGSDSLVLYSQLKSIISKFENHIHVSPAGQVSPPLNSDQSPVISKTTKPKIEMESKTSTTD